MTWVNYWNLIIWVSILGFSLNLNSLVNLLIFSEITWISLYTYSLILGGLSDDLTLYSTSFLILGLASLEFCIGYLIIILFKIFFKTTDLSDVEIDFKQIDLDKDSRTRLRGMFFKTSVLV